MQLDLCIASVILLVVGLALTFPIAKALANNAEGLVDLDYKEKQ